LLLRWVKFTLPLPGHFYITGDKMQDLGTLGISSMGYAINDSGQVAGASRTDSGWEHAFLYSNGQLQDLGTLGGYSSIGIDINANGHVVGTSTPILTIDGGAWHAFLYSNGRMQDLNPTSGDNTGQANAINDSGQIVGVGVAGRGGILYSNGQIQDLGTLGGYGSIGSDINNSGQVTGLADMANVDYHVFHAFLYSNGQMQDLGTLGGVNSEGMAINASGQVVGTSETASGSELAFLYTDGQMLDLNTLVAADLGWTLTDATGINDNGLIVANGYNQVLNISHALLLNPTTSPVPVPAALELFGSALAGWLLFGRRR
jgi:probable HAF family extracellular repeat protein